MVKYDEVVSECGYTGFTERDLDVLKYGFVTFASLYISTYFIAPRVSRKWRNLSFGDQLEACSRYVCMRGGGVRIMVC